MKEVNVFSLFSGIGAFEKALERKGIGYNLVNYCEFDKYASKSYSLIHKVPETLNLGDITKVKIDELEPYSADLITYGFPCQDISNAGKQRGFEHDGQLTRSGLFFYAATIIGRIQPKVAICENVKALVGKKFTKEFETVLSTLEDMGYTNYWQVLNAKDYGIPQNRERVFIVSIRNDIDKKYEFPTPIKLELRLKDILEKEVDEKYYLSDKMLNGFLKHNENHEEKGTGFKWKPRDIDGVASCLRANAALAPTDNTIEIKPERMGGIFDTEKSTHQAGSIWDKEKISPTIDTAQGGYRQPLVFVPEATKKGYAEAHEGDSINLEQPNSKTRRGRVGRGVAQTLTTSPQQVVVESTPSESEYIENISSKFEYVTKKTKEILDEKGYIPNMYNPYNKSEITDLAPTQTANCASSSKSSAVLIKDDYLPRIRKLTPKECFRLMGFDDNDVDILVENEISNTQLYKQAGNSIVVNVLESIFDNLVDVFDA